MTPSPRNARRGLRSPSFQKKYSCKIRPYTPKSNITAARIYCRLLRTGNPAAHRTYRLMLRGSPPDMIHSVRLRETRPSTQTGRLQTASTPPSFGESTPATADLGYREPLTPRLVWPYFTAVCKLSVLYYIKKMLALQLFFANRPVF